MAQDERNDLAVFIDFENIALGLRGRADAHFDIQKVLQRLLDIGNVIVKRAYSDWSRFGAYTRPFHEAGIELIEIPRRGDSGKNSADIRLCVDAMDLCYAKEHVDTFVIVSGDSDFSPLVSKLRENGKRVIGLGLRGSTSNLLVSNCDEFIFYESIERPAASAIPAKNGSSPAAPPTKESLQKLIVQTIAALLREGRDPIQASLVKDTIKRKQPSFTESDYGYRSFTEALEDARKHGLIEMREDRRSGTYIVMLPKPSEPAAPQPEKPAGEPAVAEQKPAPSPLPAAEAAAEAAPSAPTEAAPPSEPKKPEKPAAKPAPRKRARRAAGSGRGRSASRQAARKKPAKGQPT